MGLYHQQGWEGPCASAQVWPGQKGGVHAKELIYFIQTERYK